LLFLKPAIAYPVAIASTTSLSTQAKSKTCTTQSLKSVMHSGNLIHSLKNIRDRTFAIAYPIAIASTSARTNYQINRHERTTNQNAKTSGDPLLGR